MQNAASAGDPEPPSGGPADRLSGERLDRVRSRIAEAARRAGRDPGEVSLVAVTKSVGVAEVLGLLRLGVRDFGENRTPDLASKRDAVARAVEEDPSLGPSPRWHMIGHFQRNKVRRSLAAIDVLHSLDSLELARVVAAEAVRAGRAQVPAFVQFNVSGEGTKGGFAPEEAAAAFGALRALPALRLEGLMTMAPQGERPGDARPVFRRLRELRDWARASGYLHASALSMGMTDDFEVAVEEGSTAVRVGRALFVPGP